MGLLKGTTSLSRFQVNGELPANFWEWLKRGIMSNIFMDIEGAAEERSHGWVSIHDYFDTTFNYDTYNLNPYLLLGIRQDKRTVGASLLRKYHRLELQKAKSANPEVKISKPDREILKEKAKLSLLTRIPPQTTTWEMCWNTRNGELWFTTTNKQLLELSQELFNKSFAPLVLIPQIPFVLAGNLLPVERKSVLEYLHPLG